MGYEDLLVYSATTRGLPAHVRYAARLAGRYGARLTGAFVQSPVDPMAFDDDAELLAGIGRRHAARLAQARTLEASFAALCGEAGVSAYEWRVAEGDPVTVLALLGAVHSLLVVGAGARSGSADVDALEAIVLGAGLPCLVVPDVSVDDEPRYRRVAVAWNGSIESWRALHAALPLLADAEHVVLLKGGQRLYRTVPVPPALDVDAWLARHVRGAESIALAADDAHAGGALLEAASLRRADLLVLGAYGHSRMREWLLGGASRDVLHHLHIPVLMRH